MWLQTERDTICGVIARCGGRLYIYEDGQNPDEIKEFAQTVGFSEIFTSRKSAENMGFQILREFEVLFKKSEAQIKGLSFDFSLKNLYDRLKLGEDAEISLPSFEDFAPDVSHRLRHNAALAVLKDFGAALAFSCERGGIINGISVEQSQRGKGFGSNLLRVLTSALSGDICVCADSSVCEFYIKNGFEPMGQAVIAR
jgi:GNAT superfamily N-acetyltransferase